MCLGWSLWLPCSLPMLCWELLYRKNTPCVFLIYSHSAPSFIPFLTPDVLGERGVSWYQTIICDTSSVSIIQFNSDTNWSYHKPYRFKGSVPQDSPSHPPSPYPLETPIESSRPQVTHNFCLTWLHIRGPHDTLFGFNHLLEQLTKLQEMHLTV